MSNYNEKAAFRYDQVINQQVYKYYVRKKFGMIKKWIAKEHVVLDVGCGTGEYCIPIANQCNMVIGIDNSVKMIQRGISKARNNNLGNIGFVVGDITSLPFRDQVFDIILSVNLIHHLVLDQIIMRGFFEKIRCCKQGGHLLVFELNQKSLGWSPNPIPRIIRAILYTMLFPIHQSVLDNIEEGTRIVDIQEVMNKIDNIKIIAIKFGGFIPTYCPKSLFQVFILLEKLTEATPILFRYGAHIFVVGKVKGG